MRPSTSHLSAVAAQTEPSAAAFVSTPDAFPEDSAGRVLGAKGAFAILVYFLVAQFVFVLVGAMFLAPVMSGKSWQFVLMLLGSAYGARVALREARRSFGSHADSTYALGLRPARAGAIALCALLGAVLSLLNQMLLVRLFPPSAAQLGPLAAAASESGVWRHLLVVGMLLIAPTTEELVFRGVLFAGTAHSWGVGVAACTTTLVFSALHLRGLPPYWPALAAVGQLALATQVARIRTGSLYPGMAMHFAWNLVSMLPAWFSGH